MVTYDKNTIPNFWKMIERYRLAEENRLLLEEKEEKEISPERRRAIELLWQETIQSYAEKKVPKL